MKQEGFFDEVEGRFTANCDGGCRGNPGIGSIGVHIKNELTGEVTELYEADPETTNNKMELKAVIVALNKIPSGSRVTVRSDSQYVIKGFTEWMAGWKRRGWAKADGSPVANQELWKLLDAAQAKHKVKFEWVRGHNGDPGNTRADELTNIGMDSLKK